MIQIRGRYNTAQVMTDSLDQATRHQIQDFCDNPSFKGPLIAIMPDCHAGAGSCIGFTMPLNGRIIPDVVGVDIGCGMLSCHFELPIPDLPGLDSWIRKTIPSGFSVNDIARADTRFCQATIHRIGAENDRVARSLGSLGGGNHFIELGCGTDKGFWVTIHSGSRGFGLQIAKHHSRVAKDLCRKGGEETRGLPFLPVDSPEGQAYLEDARVGARYAALNRELMMQAIAAYLGATPVDHIESRHNFIDDTGMIRKGATPAPAGERLVIPFNMRDGLAICRGKGNPAWNWSAPHGAGRILSRSGAKAALDLEQYRSSMAAAGVYTTSADASTLDEAPEAYKDTATILASIEETVEVLELVRPVYNFKASAGD